MSPNKFDCERPAPSLCLMGLTEAELSALAREGLIQLKEREVTDAMKDVMRSVLMAVGAVAVYMGWTDEATWGEVMGGIMILASAGWSWMSA